MAKYVVFHIPSGIEDFPYGSQFQAHIIAVDCRLGMPEHPVTNTFADIEYMPVPRVYKRINIISEASLTLCLNDLLILTVVIENNMP